MDITTLLMLGGAAAVAGAINSVAGGGSLVSFPAALAAGLPQVLASATNTVAMAPGSLAAAWAYRSELGDNGRLASLLALPAMAGSIVGATLLLAAPPGVFEAIVPWLVLGATALILLKDAIWRRAATARGRPSGLRSLLVAFALLLTAVYGGYFGAGMGILILALLALLHRMNIHRMNALKTVIVGAINGLSAVYFLARGAFDGPAAVAMATGALLGGFGGASIARRANPVHVRWLVVGIGACLSAVLAYRRWA